MQLNQLMRRLTGSRPIGVALRALVSTVRARICGYLTAAVRPGLPLSNLALFEPPRMKWSVAVYTDASFEPTSQRIGWGAVIIERGGELTECFGGGNAPSANAAEFLAIAHALGRLPPLSECLVYSDSWVVLDFMNLTRPLPPADICSSRAALLQVIVELGHRVVFIWMPRSYPGIRRAHELAAYGRRVGSRKRQRR